MSPITTHVLDTAKGRPAEGVPVVLEIREESGRWKKLGAGRTNADGRAADLLPEGTRLAKAVYKLTFETGAYFNGTKAFYPLVEVVFEVADERHHHVPLLLSPYGYSTYRGS